MNLAVAYAPTSPTRDNQRFLAVPMADRPDKPEPMGEVDAPTAPFRVRPMYLADIAARYYETVRRFKQYYLHVDDVLPRLERLGYEKGKTRQLSVGMIRVLIEVHGLPD